MLLLEKAPCSSILFWQPFDKWKKSITHCQPTAKAQLEFIDQRFPAEFHVNSKYIPRPTLPLSSIFFENWHGPLASRDKAVTTNNH